MIPASRLGCGLLMGLSLSLSPGAAAQGSASKTDWTESVEFPLGAGCNGEVLALAHAPDQRIFAGGRFSQCGEVPARHVAVFDPATGRWSALGDALSNGTDAPVRALAFHEGELFVGGEFTSVADATGARAAQGFARWSGETWSAPALPRFAVRSINALLSTPEGLYAGGLIYPAPGQTVGMSAVLRWNGATLVDFDVQSRSVHLVDALAWFQGQLVIAGPLSFLPEGHAPGRAASLARWTGSGWAVVGRPGAEGPRGNVNALAVHEGALYVGGRFLTVQDGGGSAAIPAHNVARWDGSEWSALGEGTDASVFALGSTPEGLLVGGRFSRAGGATRLGLARWHQGAWAPVEELGKHPGVQVRSLATAEGMVTAGGLIGWREAAGPTPVLLNHLARLAPGGWQPLGEPIGTGANRQINDLVVHQGELYAAGQFTAIGGVPANRIARHDGSGWRALGSNGGNGLNGTVFDLLSRPDGLYIGGAFSLGNLGAEEVGLRGLARWNGTQFEPPGAGVGVGLDEDQAGSVHLLVDDGDGVLVAGLFSYTEAGGVSLFNDSLARLSAGQWSFVTAGGATTGSIPWAIDSGADGLFLGGEIFESVFDPEALVWRTTAAGVVRQGALGWEALSSPGGYGLGPASSEQYNVYPVVFALRRFQGDLYAGGRFTLADAGSANEVAVSNIARWNGVQWLPLGGPGQGPDGTVYALFPLGDQLAVLGDFARVRTGDSTFLPARGIALYGAGGWAAPRELSVGSGARFQYPLVMLPWNDGLLIGGRFGQQGERAASHLVWTLSPLFSSGFEPSLGSE